MSSVQSGWAFNVNTGNAIPPQSTSRMSVHPFPWDAMAEKIEKGETPDFVVPKAYWGGDGKDYNPTKARERIRFQFRRWQARDPKTRAVLMVIMRTFDAPDPKLKAERGDVQVWIEKMSDAEVAAAKSRTRPARAAKKTKAK